MIKTATDINVSTAQKQAAGPLYVRRYGEFRPFEAFTELDTLDGLTATTTEAEITALASELESEPDSEGIILDGCMTDWLIEMRDELRKEAEAAA